ncbi:hypothetical protein ACWCPL_40270, partial [Streptomyces sp. NPDC001948]
TATVITAAFSTLLMGVIGNVPIALAAGLAVQTTSYAGPLSRATMLAWTDEALARELGIDHEALTA